jgi:hypothetical protein
MEAMVPLVLPKKRAQSAAAEAHAATALGFRICIQCCTSHWLVQCISIGRFLLDSDEIMISVH